MFPYGTAVLVREAVKFRDNGLNAEQIAACCENLTGRIKVVAMVESLKYLKMGGRLSQTSALVGTLLHINPVISIVDGKVEVIGKSRGTKSAYAAMINYMKANKADRRHVFIYGHADAKASMEEFVRRSWEYTQEYATAFGEIGAVVGTHLGPGAVGIAYVVQEEAGINREKEAYCA